MAEPPFPAMAEPNHPGIDTSVAHPARVYDYWLGGADNFEPDRRAAQDVIAVRPTIIRDVRANRAFLSRAVRFLAESGVRQFLDLGSGLPTSPNVHQTAQSYAPECRIVYVDHDPIVLEHARTLLAGTPEGSCDYVDADFRDMPAVLERAARTLDFGRPVGVLFVGVLHLLADSDDPYSLVKQAMSATVPGSFLVLTHPAGDVDEVMVAEGAERYNAQVRTPQTRRSRRETARFFEGLEMIMPGVIQCHRWKPNPGATGLGANVAAWAGVARKR